MLRDLPILPDNILKYILSRSDMPYTPEKIFKVYYEKASYVYIGIKDNILVNLGNELYPCFNDLHCDFNILAVYTPYYGTIACAHFDNGDITILTITIDNIVLDKVVQKNIVLVSQFHHSETSLWQLFGIDSKDNWYLIDISGKVISIPINIADNCQQPKLSDIKIIKNSLVICNDFSVYKVTSQFLEYDRDNYYHNFCAIYFSKVVIPKNTKDVVIFKDRILSIDYNGKVYFENEEIQETSTSIKKIIWCFDMPFFIDDFGVAYWIELNNNRMKRTKFLFTVEDNFHRFFMKKAIH